MFNRICFQSGGMPLLLAFFIFFVDHAPAQDGLVALYTFEEGDGNIVRDVSGVGAALDLEIANPAAVSWLPGGGISFDAQTLIASREPASKIVDACQDSNELTVEIWAKPANLIQAGPARLVSVSANPSNRNFTMGQDAGSWIMRVRTPVTGDNGSANGTQFSAGSAVETRLTHVVFTRDASEMDAFYIDGMEDEERSDVGGDFSTWNDGYRLGIGGELDNSRQWLGEIQRVAIYNRAWTAEEVAQAHDELTLKLDVVDMEPPRGTHYHPAAEGIRFRAVALSDNTIDDNGVTLMLNGEDRSTSLEFNGSATDREVTFMGLEPNESYVGEVIITDNNGESRSVALDFQTHTLRADGLVALYTFDEGEGAVIHDRSGVGPALDLTIADMAGIRWLAGGGLAIEEHVNIASAEPATKILQPVVQSGAVTIEALIRSTSDLSGPARIVTISEFRQNFPGDEVSNSLRNLTLAQEGDIYQAYLRTTETDEAGNPPLNSAPMDVSFISQVVYTRDTSGEARLYIDGQEVEAATVGGSLSNWLEGYRLGIGGELNRVTQAPEEHNFRHWEGALYRVAIYNQALTPDQFGGPAFAITNIVRDRVTSEVTMTWNSRPLQSYTVEMSFDLATWIQIADEVASEGEITSYAVDPGAAGEAYYRVGLLVPVPPLSTDFENGEEGWTVVNESGDTSWELGTPDVEGLAESASGTNAWGTDLDANYGSEVVTTLRSPLIDLTGLFRPRLSFNYFIDSTQDLEGGQLRFLDESGTVIFTREEIFSGQSEGWTPFVMAIPTELTDQMIMIEFRFLSDEDELTGAGWYIDDVVVDR